MLNIKMSNGIIEITNINDFNYILGIIEYKKIFDNKNLIKKSSKVNT